MQVDWMIIYAAAGVAGFLLIMCLVAFVCLYRARKTANLRLTDNLRLTGELEQLKSVSAVKEAEVLRRLEDKDEVCRQRIADRDAACARALEEKGLACANQLQEKERACATLLAEKDAALERKEAECQARLRDRDEQCGKALREKQEAIERFLEEKERAFAESVKTLREQFATLAAERLKIQSADLSEKNARDIKPLFDSLEKKIAEFKQASESARVDNEKLGAELKTHICEVGQKAQSLGKQAEDFMTALKGGNKNQGNWGEGIVRNALEGAGLKAGTDFTEQVGARDAGLPDFTVFDGVHRKILIDAKVNIDAFLSAVQASHEGRIADAEARMREHAKSVRTQIAGLAERNYPRKLKERDADKDAEYSPVVIMAMPSEATYAAALSADPQIGTFANERNIALASPQMLFGYLVLFKLGIDRLKVDRNNQEIVRRASQILSRMDAAFAALEEIGKALEKAQAQYHQAMNKLRGDDGGHNVLAPARELAKLMNATEKRHSEALAENEK